MSTTAGRSYTSRKRTHTPRPRTRKDGSVWYQVRYYVTRDGRRVQTSHPFEDPTAAERFAKNLDTLGVEQAEKILDAQLKVAAAPMITISGWLRQYADRLRSVSEAQRTRYHRFIDLDVTPFMGELPIDAYTEDLDAAWVLWLATEVQHKPYLEPGNSAKTVKNKHGFVSEAMAAAARHRPTPLVPSNPCAYTRLPHVDGRRRDFLTPAEYELFEALLWPRYRPMFEFMVMSMCRPGEVFALTVGDVDAGTGAVNVDKAWKCANGKRVLGAPKSSRGVRTTYVPLDTIGRLDLDRNREELLFPTGVGTEFTVQGFYRQIWMPAVARLEALANTEAPGRDANGFDQFGSKARWPGESAAQLLARFGRDTVDGLLGKWVVPYITRHTGISWRLQDGVPIWVVSRDAGHQSVQTTDKNYGHIDNRTSLSAAQQVADRLPGLRRNVADLELARRRRLVRNGQLGEVYPVGDGFEACWKDAEGVVQSAVFDDYEIAVHHIAVYEAGDPTVDAA